MATLRKVRAVEKHRRRRARRVRVGRPDGQLTSAAGLEAVRELDRVLGVTGALQAGIGAVKERRRGLGGGALVMAMASCQLTGGDFLVSLDRRRADLAGQLLEPVPTPAATTAAGIAKRFTDTHLRGIETAIGKVNTTMVSLVPTVRRSTLLKVATIDGDATDVEVYGRQKEQVEYNHTGQRNLRAHIAFWAEAGVPLAAELMAGAADPRSNSVEILVRAIAALPAGVEHVKARWDAGYFARELAEASSRAKYPASQRALTCSTPAGSAAIARSKISTLLLRGSAAPAINSAASGTPASAQNAMWARRLR